jgi:hypothetical protein
MTNTDDSPAGRARARLGSKTGDWTRFSIAVAAAEGQRMRQSDMTDDKRRRLVLVHWAAVHGNLQVRPARAVHVALSHRLVRVRYAAREQGVAALGLHRRRREGRRAVYVEDGLARVGSAAA